MKNQRETLLSFLDRHDRQWCRTLSLQLDQFDNEMELANEDEHV